jgi:uncharacterized protein (TIGR02996 family)
VNEREAFLNALAENQDDVTTRLVFADWLDERGEHEEADSQRRWVAAREWLVKFCHDNNPPAGRADPYGSFISYEKLMDLAREAIEIGYDEHVWYECRNNDALCAALRDNEEEFWKNAALVTGAVPFPQLDDDGSGCPGGGGC